MLKLPKIIARTLSFKLSLIMVCAIALLLTAALGVMFLFSHQALKEEALCGAEETLEGTNKHIDNILLSVEQAAGNIYWDLINHLNQPDRMDTYCRELVESNQHIEGCAIAFKPYFYPGRELFMTYVFRKGVGKTTSEDSKLLVQDHFGNRPYTEQVWYTDPLSTGRAVWTNPLKEDDREEEDLITFCLPIFDQSMTSVGVLAVDVSVSGLSQTVLVAKPSTNGYVVMLSRDGSFMIHPDQDKLSHQTVFTLTEHGDHPSMREAAEAMLKGESGFKPFTMDNQQWYVLFKPFQRDEVPGRAMEDLGWSIGVVYLDDEIFHHYNLLLYIMTAITIVGLLLFFVLCRLFTRRELWPLNFLTRSAQRIAAGNYAETIPDTKREDEVGRLQVHFQKMQQALKAHIDEQERLSAQLQERGEVLQKAYRQAQKADQMKTAFLHFMTNQMLEPAGIIEKCVADICNHGNGSSEDTGHLADTVRQQGEALIEMLNRLMKEAEDKSQDFLKEVTHE